MSEMSEIYSGPERRKDNMDVILDMKNACSDHRIELTSRFNNLENNINNVINRTLNLETSLVGVDIKSMATSIKNIEQRLFKTNGTRALITEVQDIHKEIDNHLGEHKENRMTKAKITLMMLGILMTSSVGTFVSFFILKALA